MLTYLTKGVGGVGEMLTVADEGGSGGLTPPFLAKIICEQPLMKQESFMGLNLICRN